MSVYVKGMEMPTNCAQCACCDDEVRFCHAAHQYIPMIGRPKFCPLVEVQTHDKRTETHGVCSDTISRQAAMDYIGSMNMVDQIDEQAYIEAMNYFESLPSASKSGKWIHDTHYGLNLPEHKCSECGTWEYSDEESNFCPNCGADMREREGE